MELTGAERLFSRWGMVALFPNCRFVGRFCFIGNDIRLGASALAYAHPGRRTISMLRMDDIQAGGLNDIREPGLADVKRTRLVGSTEPAGVRE